MAKVYSNVTDHAKQRINQRVFAKKISEIDREAISYLIRIKRSVYIFTTESLDNVFAVWYNGKWIPAVIDHKTNKIVTVLPLSVLADSRAKGKMLRSKIYREIENISPVEYQELTLTPDIKNLMLRHLNKTMYENQVYLDDLIMFGKKENLKKLKQIISRKIGKEKTERNNALIDLSVFMDKFAFLD